MPHTPGPWKVADRFYILMADDVACEVAKVCDENIDDDMLGQCDADARLIAAAPEMLAALRRMREVFEQLADGDWRELDATYVDQLIESDGLLGCDQAIAKAEGRSE